MNILLTNDDGVDSAGILTLAKFLKARSGHSIFILAPDRNRSGVSHGLSIFSSSLEFTEKGNGVFSCSGLPADCVLAAVLGGKPCKPDIVISGINHGANLGSDIIYSGTCAAARQAALMGIPGIALSLKGWDNYDWERTASCAADYLDEFLSMWKEDTFINVNFPNGSEPPGGIVRTWPAIKKYNDTIAFKRGDDGREYCTLNPGRESVEDNPGSDWGAVARNMISVSSVFVYPVVRRDLCEGAPDYAAAGKRRP